MGLKETIKETKDRLEEVLAEETKEEKTALEPLEKAVSEVIEEPKKEEVKAEEKPKEEVKEEKPAEEKTPAEHAKERIAKKKNNEALAEQLAAANARLAALEASVKPVEVKKDVADPEPNAATQPLEWAQWKIRKQDQTLQELSGWKSEQDTVKKRETLQEQALREVATFENQLRPTYPDYDQVKEHYSRMLASAIKIVNPKITQPDLVKAVNNRLLTRASELLAEGYENPVEAMYLEAKALGYQPKVEEAKEEKEIKPDLDKVAQLRKRNAGMAGAAGSGGESDVITPAVAVKMTNAQFAKLKPEQKKRLFQSLRG